jgi:DNA-binding HxlR family transcriptional regulator
MNKRNISQISKKLLQVEIMMAEADQFLNRVRVDESMPFPEIHAQITNAMNQIASGKVIIQNILEELLKELQDGQ